VRRRRWTPQLKKRNEAATREKARRETCCSQWCRPAAGNGASPEDLDAVLQRAFEVKLMVPDGVKRLSLVDPRGAALKRKAAQAQLTAAE